MRKALSRLAPIRNNSKNYSRVFSLRCKDGPMRVTEQVDLTAATFCGVTYGDPYPSRRVNAVSEGELSNINAQV